MSTERDHRQWPLREHWVDIAWGLFAAVNLVAMLRFATWETVPFHFIWVSMTLVYGFRVWGLKPTLLTLCIVVAGTALCIGVDVHWGKQPMDELTEVPLMSAMFLAMVWHARRRLVALEETNRVSEQNLRLLERERKFIQDASHELRTPITVALGHAELIERTSEDPVVAEDARVVTDELMRLRRLADRLLLLAASDSPHFLERGELQVRNIVRDATRRWSATPRRWRVGNLTDDHVEADKDRLSLALDALIENAVKHTDADSAIELSARREAGSVVISVRDEGSGITAEGLDSVFHRFARVDPSRSREVGGIGLGLALVKAIAEAHGGSVRATSRLGEGSNFEILLPRTAGKPPGGVELARSTPVGVPEPTAAGWP